MKPKKAKGRKALTCKIVTAPSGNNYRLFRTNPPKEDTSFSGPLMSAKHYEKIKPVTIKVHASKVEKAARTFAIRRLRGGRTIPLPGQVPFITDQINTFFAGYIWLCDWLSRQKKKTIKELINAARALKEVP